MLHCWPFINETAYLAKNRSNFYIDICWVPVLSPTLFSQALETYLNFVPNHKIMFSHDATTIEMAVGSSSFTREILQRKLLEQKALLNLSDDQLRNAAIGMMNNNAVSLYRVGKYIE